jgi:uncharacterized protein YqeY
VTKQPAERWRATLRDALLAPRKSRDAKRVSALRSALAAIDNAETPDAASVDAPSSETIAAPPCGAETEVLTAVLGDV